MSFDNVFVIGPVEPVELGDVLQSYEPSWILTDFDRPLFGHPVIQIVRTSDVPVAYLDWSFGRAIPRQTDLAVSPDEEVDQLADLVVSWILRS